MARSYTIKIVFSFLKLIGFLILLAIIAGLVYLNYALFYPPKDMSAEKVSDIICVLLAADPIAFIISMIIIIINFDDIDYYCSKKIDPTLIKICDFINRRNGGCKDAEL